MPVIEQFTRDDQFWRESGLPHTDAPVEALQYTGTAESAEAIATTFGLTVRVQFERVAVFAVPTVWAIAVDDYDYDNREFGIVRSGWVWRDPATHSIGAEWDEYFGDHFTPTRPANAADVGVR